ncbi:aminodeoxychorismate/anthranilate synthase component II [Deltaproteobacteria bacterium TL4]
MKALLNSSSHEIFAHPKRHVVIIDNYDSFTYNLVQVFGELGSRVSVVLNDQISVEALQTLTPTHLCVSPGPGSPQTAGISKALIKRYCGELPILGVCLGHQCIAEVFGGRIIPAAQILHGKTSLIYHPQVFPFEKLPNPFPAMRYHSLIVDWPSLPPCLLPLAWTEQKELMAVRHEHYPLLGIQFHPESILTPLGNQILNDFLQWKVEVS